MALLELKNICFETDNQLILKNISVTIEPGDFVSIIGPSGSGKSTFLKLCSHLISPTSGELLFNGISVDEYSPIELRKRIAYCFQLPYLFGDTVRDNIVFPYYIRNLKVDNNRINELLSIFNIPTDFLDKDIKGLSGGEKQRIALIRSLIFTPDILLLDEVTSALDIDNTAVVENVIKSLNEEGVTVLWITHNLEQSRKYAKRLLTIESGQIKSLEILV